MASSVGATANGEGFGALSVQMVRSAEAAGVKAASQQRRSGVRCHWVGAVGGRRRGGLPVRCGAGGPRAVEAAMAAAISIATRGSVVVEAAPSAGS